MAAIPEMKRKSQNQQNTFSLVPLFETDSGKNSKRKKSSTCHLNMSTNEHRGEGTQDNHESPSKLEGITCLRGYCDFSTGIA